jgi:hypothetical protein
MANTKAKLITVKSFLGMEQLTGELRVVGSAYRRREARPRKNVANKKTQLDLAATVDGSGETAGGDATSAAAAAVRETYAGAAEGRAKKSGRAAEKKEQVKKKGSVGSTRKPCGRGIASDGQKKEQKKELSANREREATGSGIGSGGPPSLWDQKMELEGGSELPEDGTAFVEAVHKRIDLVRLTELVLKSLDERLTQRQLEQLLELKYGKDAREVESSSMGSYEIPRPKRD